MRKRWRRNYIRKALVAKRSLTTGAGDAPAPPHVAAGSGAGPPPPLKGCGGAAEFSPNSHETRRVRFVGRV